MPPLVPRIPYNPRIPRIDNIVEHGRKWIRGDDLTRRGVSNPYGTGVAAFEPNTEVLDLPPLTEGEPGLDTYESDNPLLVGYADAFNAVQQSRAEESALGASLAAPFDGPMFTGGPVKSVIDAAKSLLGKPYVWGGTTSRGVDCSGLIYYAFNAAGIPMPRYRAIDYGTRVGHTVAAGEARPGDLVYFDNPGTSTDHVGLYLGNGQMIQAPQSGDVVRITPVGSGATFRRVVDDAAFGRVATPTGSALSYGGAPADLSFAASPVRLAAPDLSGMQTLPPGYRPPPGTVLPSSGIDATNRGKVRAI